jgi:beta-lactamase class D
MTGVAPDAGHTIAYDSARHRASGFWTPAWSRDHTLRSAVNNSVYWYFQEIARGIGPEYMHRYLERFDYGNCDMGGGLDRFWLRGDLRISPDEQVRFLRRFYEGEFDLSARTTEMVQDILLLEETPQYCLSGKTGTADVTATREMAWLVGYVERDERTWFFALNMEGEEVWERWGAPAGRLDLVRTLLRETGMLPARGSRGE